MRLTDYEIQSLKEIRKWEEQKHGGLHKRLLDAASRPVDHVIEKIGRAKFRAFEKTLSGAIRSLLEASTFTIGPEKILERARKYGIQVSDLSDLWRHDLAVIDKCNRKEIKFHERAAAIQGAVAGLGGGFLAAGDLTAVIVQDFHLLQEIAFCHGIDSTSKVEKQIVLRIILGAIGGSDLKRTMLGEIEDLKNLEVSGIKEEASHVALLGSKAIEGYVQKLAVRLIVRLAPRTVPLLSVAVSAHSNREILEVSAEMAMMVYRKRFIERKERLLE